MANLVGDATIVRRVGRPGTPGLFLVQEGVGCVLEWRLRWHGRSVGDVTDCRPEWPTGDTWVVFDGVFAV